MVVVVGTARKMLVEGGIVRDMSSLQEDVFVLRNCDDVALLDDCPCMDRCLVKLQL